MKWYEEIRLTRRPLEQIGIAFLVREVFGNDMRMSVLDADDVLGPGWRSKAEELKKAGALRMEIGDGMVHMTVEAPGDVKRDIMRRYIRKVRRISKEQQK